MSKFVRLILAGAVCLLLAGCAPQDSLFPLFLKSDKVFEEGILGEWMVQGGTQEIKSDEKSDETFQRGAEDLTYDITMPDIEEDGATLASTGRLVRLGSYLFIDLASSDLERRKNAIVRIQR
jgi:hypothetical protein